MHASHSEDDGSDAMFPTANEPTTPGRTSTLLNILDSPPLSQDPSEPTDAAFLDDMMDFTESANADTNQNGFEPQFPSAVGKPGKAGRGQLSHTLMGQSAKKRGPENEVGYAWDNRKAREEYQRAMEQVVDKKFNLSKLPQTLMLCDRS